MTQVDPRHHAGELGVAFVQRTCAGCGVIFRPIRMYDVGIDGIMEPELGHIATGFMIGVQIKTVDSYRRRSRRSDTAYVFASDRPHFAYWARCSLSIVGIVYDPVKDCGVWTNLTKEAVERGSKGPFSIPLTLERNPFSPASLPAMLEEVATFESHRRVAAVSRARRSLPSRSPSLALDRAETWDDLLELFLSVLHDDRSVAAAGYRLSWYFPTLGRDSQDYTIARIGEMNDLNLVKVVGAMAVVLEDNQEHVAEHPCDLLAYVPDVVKRLEFLYRKGAFPKGTETTVVQAMEVVSGRVEGEALLTV